MELLISCPAFIKIGISFAAILIATRFGIGLGYAIIGSATLLTLWTGTGTVGVMHQLTNFLSPENYVLLFVVILLLFFTDALDKTGKMKKTIDALSHWLKSPRLLLAGFPILVGLLPMPGGALFSAPLVDAVDTDKKLKPAHKAAINYWFRHIWEYWWPLYPGIILAIKISGLPSGLFYLIQMPFTLAALAGGYMFIMRGTAKRIAGEPRGKLDISALAVTLVPIGVLVILSLVGSFTFPAIGMTKTLANLIGMICGLLLGLIAIFWKNTAAFPRALGMFAKKNTWELMLLVVGIQMFAAALTVPLSLTETMTLVTQMRDELLRMGIPILLVIAIVPFVTGAVTGVAFGFVGASFPIVFALLGPSPDLNIVLAATTFAYGFGYMGMILSPVHVCLVVTNQYFKAKMKDVYRYILLPVLVVLISGCVMSGAYYLLVK